MKNIKEIRKDTSYLMKTHQKEMSETIKKLRNLDMSPEDIPVITYGIKLILKAAEGFNTYTCGIIAELKNERRKA